MDIISHGLWGSIAFGRKSRKDFIWAFLFGIAPDFFSFGLFWIAIWLGLQQPLDWSAGLPPMEAIAGYVHSLYNITHSLIVFGAVFGLVYAILRKPFWPMLAWGLHIVFDIFTHTREFFPTPFLWPVSDFKISVANWSEPYIFIPNVLVLAVLYLWFYFSRRPRSTTTSNSLE
jgi:hypothetical protein